jgi:hypothetical protein
MTKMNFIQKEVSSQIWWYTSIIPALRRLREDN